MTDHSDIPALRRALSGYLEARSGALLAARQALGIGEGDARALLRIAESPGIRPTQLRQFLGITAAGVTALIDRLVERGAVRREVDPDDRRVNRITLTIDLAEEPWDQLTQFDTDFDAAILAADAVETDRFAALLDELILTTTGRLRG